MMKPLINNFVCVCLLAFSYLSMPCAFAQSDNLLGWAVTLQYTKQFPSFDAVAPLK